MCVCVCVVSSKTKAKTTWTSASASNSNTKTTTRKKREFAFNKNVTFHKYSIHFFESISVHLTFLKCSQPENQWPTNWMAKKVFHSFLHLSFRCGAMRAHNRHSTHLMIIHRQCFNFNGFANEMTWDERHKTVLVTSFVCLLSVIIGF